MNQAKGKDLKQYWKEERIRSRMDFTARVPLIPAKKESFAELLNTDPINQRDNLIYIHIPFCTSICNFCGYAKKILNQKEAESYFRQLEKQIDDISAYPNINKRKFTAVSFGGGSPGCLPAEYIAGILKKIKQKLSLIEEAEISIELRPEEIDDRELRAYFESGINRISIGVQSFHTKLRQAYGRKLSQQELIEKLKIARESPISNIYIDLIYNLPGQNLGLWEEDLQYLVDMAITGCSIYPLIIFPKSGIGNKYAGKPYPCSEHEFQYYERASKVFLEELDWECYTPVQFGHSDFKSLYIQKIAEQSDILALGPNAGGRIDSYQYLMQPNPDDYINSKAESIVDLASLFHLNPAFLKFKSSLRLGERGFLSKEVFDWEACEMEEALDFLISKDLVEESAQYYQLNQKGRFWAGNISDFLLNLISVKL
jgi:coproporphyrinogen III oxidase-like Fe-S oxidoreductase